MEDTVTVAVNQLNDLADCLLEIVAMLVTKRIAVSYLNDGRSYSASELLSVDLTKISIEILKVGELLRTVHTHNRTDN